MKKIAMILLITFFMSLICISAARAALHPNSKYIENRWYTVEEDENPYTEGLVTVNDDDDRSWMGQYYYNDQTFFNINYNESITDISGSYLWKNGFFLGVEYTDLNDMNGDDGGDSWGIHPGYRWNLKRGYFAFSIDYYKRSEGSHEPFEYDQDQKGIELYWVYFPENMKIQTDLLLTKRNSSLTFDGSEQAAEERRLLFGQMVNYKVSDNLVLGFDLNYGRGRGELSYYDGYSGARRTREDESTNIGSGLGFTWEPKYFILNGAISAAHTKGFEASKEYDFSLVIPFCQQFELGIGYSNQSYRGMNYENKDISFQYNIKEGSALRLSYDTTEEIWSLLYHQDM